MSFFKNLKKLPKDNNLTATDLKYKNIEFLKSKGIHTFESLPILDEPKNTILRSKTEIVQRAIALVLIAVYAEGLHDPQTNREEHKKLIESLITRYSAQGFFSPKEQAFFDHDNPSGNDIINFSWQYEPYVVMLWALSFLEADDALDVPATLCDVSRAVRILREHMNYEEFYEAGVVRSKESIIEQADLIYRYDWVCVDERINNVSNPTHIWGIVMERHKALNWLINYGYEEPQDWDLVSTDT